jgi:hypothetical protein
MIVGLGLGILVFLFWSLPVIGALTVMGAGLIEYEWLMAELLGPGIQKYFVAIREIDNRMGELSLGVTMLLVVIMAIRWAANAMINQSTMYYAASGEIMELGELSGIGLMQFVVGLIVWWVVFAALLPVAVAYFVVDALLDMRKVLAALFRVPVRQ